LKKIHIFATKKASKPKTIEIFKMKTIIQVILIVAIFVVAYFVYESIQQPLRFKAEEKRRSEVTIQRLKDIRTAEVAYRSEYKKYTGSFDTLIDFLKTGKFKVIMQIGDEDDSAAVQGGKIIRDTILVNVLDSLFKKDYPVDSIRYVPFTQGVQFELGTANLEAGKVIVNVFEAKIAFDVLLKGLDPQLLFNHNADKEKKTGYPGLKVGSLTETTNNAGNWE
jgi:tellurite resistance protein